MKRHAEIVKAVTCAVLFAITLRLAVPIWTLFLFFAGYYGFKAIRKRTATMTSPEIMPNRPIGKLGEYDVDGGDSEPSYGLYLQLKGKPVFVDIRKDKLLAQREQRAILLHERSVEIEQSLASFVSNHSEFSVREIATIGLHSKDIERGEVFWEPEGACVLQGFQFIET